MLSKTHTIEAILDLNPTANPTFLAEFPPTDLTNYLFRLVDAGRSPNSMIEHVPAENDVTASQGVHA